MNSITRVAYHAGSWYKDDPSLLAKEIGDYLSKSGELDQYQSLKSIIVPHAGYRFWVIQQENHL